MDILWNQINLPRPPFRSWDVSIAEFDPKQFIGVIDNILNDLDSFQVINSEAALLSRLIYRMKSKFRSDKGLKNMEKINRALLNFLNMSIEREYEVLKEYIEFNNDIVSMPPQQSLEYVLVKTQGFSKLMCRVESTAMIAGQFLQSRFISGQSWSVAMIAYGVVSRIWMLSRHIVKKICTWYDKLYKFIDIFKPVGISWLPENYQLPIDLYKWLEVSWSDDDLKKLPGKNNLKNSLLDSIIDSKTLVDSTQDEPAIKKLSKNQKNFTPTPKSGIKQENDLGKRISRENFDKTSKEELKQKETAQKTSQKPASKKKKESQKSLLLNIKNEKNLVKLLSTKTYPGFNNLQWNKFKKRIIKLSIKLTKNNTCDLDKKKIDKINSKIKLWSEDLQ